MSNLPKITKSALLRRVNRKLAHDQEKVIVSRIDSDAYREFGRYYLQDTHANRVIGSHLDLEELARDLGVLGAAECVESAGDEVSR